MSIPESQLETWAKYHQTNKAKYTHERVRNIINNYDYSQYYNFEDYLQGSYRNHTNIHADTDVDIVIQLNSIFRGNTSLLTKEQTDEYDEHYSSASYSLEDFKNEVIKALCNGFGYNRIEIGNKSIKVLADNSGNMYNADVVVAMEYRLYVPDERENTEKDSIGLHYFEGILFTTYSGEEIINYPKLHYKNGNKKQENTNGLFKPIVRIFKNMRNNANEKWYLVKKDIAPSYFIQCLLYNVPNYIFDGSYQEIIENILNYLNEELNNEESYKRFISQNEIVPLFGSESDKWDITNARIFIDALIKMWNNWE